jgi:heme/copper-type cytochrome/quinol oxidase subunit 2
MPRFRTIILATCMVLALCTVAQACPMCKDSVPSSDAQQAGALPSGFNNSIYFILVSFLTVLGTVLTLIVRTIRQGAARPAFEVVASPQNRPVPRA